MAMHVVGLKIQDLRNIDLVDIDFSNHRWIEITGKNGAAKSTVLDALFLAMSGPKYLGRGFPAWVVVKADREKALIKVTLKSEDRTIEVKRSIRKKEGEDGRDVTQSLLVQDTEGKSFNQDFLDRLVSDFTVDPLNFAKKSPKEQAGIIRELSGVSTEKLDEEKKEVYDARTFINREITALQGKLSGVEPIFAEPVDVSKLLKQRKEIDDRNAKRREYAAQWKDANADLAGRQSRVSTLRAEIEQLTADLEEAVKIASKVEAKVSSMKAPEPEEKPDAIDLAIKEAAQTNDKAARYKAFQSNMAELETKKAESDSKTKRLDEIEKEKKDLMKKSNLPFEGVEFNDSEGLIINGIAFSQLSTAEQIKVSTRIGIELKPELRVICIRDGSALDEKSVEYLRSLAEEMDYQIIVEMVEERQGEDCIVMRAGQAISKFESEDKPKPRKTSQKSLL